MWVLQREAIGSNQSNQLTNEFNLTSPTILSIINPLESTFTVVVGDSSSLKQASKTLSNSVHPSSEADAE